MKLSAFNLVLTNQITTRGFLLGINYLVSSDCRLGWLLAYETIIVSEVLSYAIIKIESLKFPNVTRNVRRFVKGQDVFLFQLTGSGRLELFGSGVSDNKITKERVRWKRGECGV